MCAVQTALHGLDGNKERLDLSLFLDRTYLSRLVILGRRPYLRAIALIYFESSALSYLDHTLLPFLPARI